MTSSFASYEFLCPLEVDAEQETKMTNTVSLSLSGEDEMSKPVYYTFGEDENEQLGESHSDLMPLDR